MKRLAAATVLVLSASLAQAADDPTGTWKWEVPFKGKTTTSTLKLKLDGNKLTGTYISGSGKEAPIQDARFSDGKMTFMVKGDTGTIKTTVEFDGTVKGDTITGRVISTSDRNGDIQSSSQDWEAKRQN